MIEHRRNCRVIMAIVLGLLTFGCSQNTKNVNSTLKEIISSGDDVNQTREEIMALPFASANVNLGDAAQIYLVLAYAEPDPEHLDQTQLKWVTSDRSMLVTENGRLIKTLGLSENNLIGVHAVDSQDPLMTKGQKPKFHTWQAVYDWQPGYRFNFVANIQWQFVAEEVVESTTWKKNTDYYQEKVSIPSLDRQFTNHFWIDKRTHQVVKSIQSLGPDMLDVRMVFVKPFEQ